MADVFISYRRDDRAKAEALAKALKVENLDVWWDAGLETGDTFDQKIQEALQAAKAVIVLWSPSSVKSDWVRAESTVGRERGMLVPVMVRNCVIPVPFNLIHTADLTGWSGDRAHPAYKGVVKEVKEKAGKAHVPPLKPPPNRALRRLWRALAAVAVLAAAGASVWVFRPWEAVIAANDPVLRAQKIRATAIAKLAPLGVGADDLDTLSSRAIATQRFKPESHDQLTDLANGGNAPAQAVLCAVAHWGAAGHEPDVDLAFDSCTKSADAGEAAGQFFLSELYEEDALEAVGDSQREAGYASATAQIRKAAEQGYAPAQVAYGWRLRDGQGVPADPALAEDMFKAAQVKGLAAADHGLGRLYLSGEIAGPDEVDAMAMIRKAADAGHQEAQFDMAEYLVAGWYVTEDLDAALAYYKAAAEGEDDYIAGRSTVLIPDTEARIAQRDAPPEEPAPDQ